jgi:hypothetical protein
MESFWESVENALKLILQETEKLIFYPYELSDQPDPQISSNRIIFEFDHVLQHQKFLWRV